VATSSKSGQGGWNVDDVLAGGGQQLRDTPPQPSGTFDSEAALRPAGDPVGQRLVRGGVDGNPPCRGTAPVLHKSSEAVLGVTGGLT
jgi:hypothetical protein